MYDHFRYYLFLGYDSTPIRIKSHFRKKMTTEKLTFFLLTSIFIKNILCEADLYSRVSRVDVDISFLLPLAFLLTSCYCYCFCFCKCSCTCFVVNDGKKIVM